MNSDNKPPKKTMRKNFWFRLGAIVFLLVGVRGFMIAKLIGGSYSISSLLFDAVAASIILVVLQFSDQLLIRGLKASIGDTTRVRKFASAATRLVIVVLLFGTFLLATVQMHPPKIACKQTPTDFGLEYSEHVVEASDGVKISVWAIPASTPDRPVVVLTHGLGANKQNFMYVASLIHALEYNVVAFDFRGHGDSEGHTCSLGVREAEDVKAAHDFAKSHFPDRPVFAWSTSMGAAATLRASAKYGIFDKLVVDASFSSVKNLAMTTKFCYLGPFGKPAWHISRLWFFAYVGADIDDYSPQADIETLTQPVFLIHGTGDKIIPHTESDRLTTAAKEGTVLWKVENAGHSASCMNSEYATRLLAFYDAAE